MRDTRHRAIRAILKRSAVGTQSELADALRRIGHAVDQSTLSRDLRELSVHKVGGRYMLPHANGAGRRVSNGVAVLTAAPVAIGGQASAAPRLLRSAAPCGPHLIVVRTQVGQAQPVALAIDAQAEPAIVATLAGDDAIFVAVRNRKAQAVALRRLNQWFGEPTE